MIGNYGLNEEDVGVAPAVGRTASSSRRPRPSRRAGGRPRASTTTCAARHRRASRASTRARSRGTCATTARRTASSPRSDLTRGAWWREAQALAGARRPRPGERGHGARRRTAWREGDVGARAAATRRRRRARFHVVAYDSGIKRNILRQLARGGLRGHRRAGRRRRRRRCSSAKPDGVFLSNGPGDPEAVPYLVESVRGCSGGVPIFGICLGHQILGLAARRRARTSCRSATTAPTTR